MLVVLTLLTFILFAALDYVLHHRTEAAGEASQLASASASASASLPVVPEPAWVAGYELPEGLQLIGPTLGPAPLFSGAAVVEGALGTPSCTMS